MPKRCILGRDEAGRLLKERVRLLREHVEAAAAHNPDGIHDLRVASRRLRALLAAHAAYFGHAEQEAFNRQVGLITRGLGKARELDVTLGLVEGLRKHLDGTPRKRSRQLGDWLRARRESERQAVGQATGVIGCPVFNGSLVALLETVSPIGECYIKEAKRRLRKRYANLIELYLIWRQKPSEEALHRIRVGFKKLRYTCELYACLYGSAMADFLKQLKRAQDALGAWNDYRVLRNYVRLVLPECADEAPALCKAVEAKAAESLDEFRAFSKEFFQPSRRKEIKGLFRDVQRECCMEAVERPPE